MPTLDPTYGTLNAPILNTDDWQKLWTWKYPDGSPVNLTGNTYVATVDLGDEVVTLDMTYADLANGKFTTLLHKEDLAGVASGRYNFKIVQTDSGLITTTVIIGYLAITNAE